MTRDKKKKGLNGCDRHTTQTSKFGAQNRRSEGQGCKMSWAKGSVKYMDLKRHGSEGPAIKQERHVIAKDNLRECPLLDDRQWQQHRWEC